MSFGQAAEEVQGDIDAAYHAKYDGYGPRIAGSVTGPGVHRLTIHLVPQTSQEQ